MDEEKIKFVTKKLPCDSECRKIIYTNSYNCST